ncbi:MAG: DivIVA domain-containing protein, partial [Chthonomonadaceae bacterium]|nr:DivIVA domain-containing protein [Chthonomonadaceae bacterium]
MSFQEQTIGSERLTPVDILNIHFSRRLRGYAVAEVDEFVRRVAADMEAVLTEVAQLRDRVAVLERELTQYRALETNMRDALVLAQKAAEETRTAAQAQAQARMQEADARLAEV